MSLVAWTLMRKCRRRRHRLLESQLARLMMVLWGGGRGRRRISKVSRPRGWGRRLGRRKVRCMAWCCR
jgi:hypothetical protein